MKTNFYNARKQTGAALAVALVLLLVLTILAIAGVNSASLGLIMAGNEQFRANAFQAAETGVEQVLLNGVFATNVSAVASNATIAGTSDTYSTSLELPNVAPTAPLWAQSDVGKFQNIHFQIVSTGASARNSTATHSQGVAVLTLKDSQVTCLGTTCGLN